MLRIRSLVLVALCIGCFGFGQRVFALGESCTAPTFSGMVGVCVDFNDSATYDVSTAGCAEVATEGITCAPDARVGQMACARNCLVAYPSGSASDVSSGLDWSYTGSVSDSSSVTGSGSGSLAATSGGSDSGTGGPPFTGVGSGSTGSGSRTVTCPPGTTLDGGTCLPTNVGLSTGTISTSFGSIFSFSNICFSGPVLCVLATFLSWILTVLGVVTVISFVIAGLQYMFALGNPKGIETAKAHMTWSIVGLIVALSGVIAIIQINSWLGA